MFQSFPSNLLPSSRQHLRLRKLPIFLHLARLPFKLNVRRLTTPYKRLILFFSDIFQSMIDVSLDQMLSTIHLVHKFFVYTHPELCITRHSRSLLKPAAPDDAFHRRLRVGVPGPIFRIWSHVLPPIGHVYRWRRALPARRLVLRADVADHRLWLLRYVFMYSGIWYMVVITEPPLCFVVTGSRD